MLFIVFFFINIGALYSQANYNLVGGNATVFDSDSDCYRLTTEVGTNQTGAAWNEAQIDLSCDFNWSGTFNVGFESGADGMAFMFQNTGINQAAAPSLTGIPAITSLAIEFDSYENNMICSSPPVDPCGGCVGDHVAVYRNGNPVLPLVSPKCVPLFADTNDHTLDIVWKHSTNTLTVLIDNVLVITYNRDIAQTIFGGNSMVYYGFVSRTGNLTNEHSFCHTASSNDNCCPADNGFSN